MPTVLAKPSVKDRQRWYLWRSEKPMEEIAARDRVAVETIKESIDKVEAYRYIASAEEVDMAYNMMALELVDSQKKVLKEAMNAKTYRIDTNGKEKVISDHATRLKALDVAREFASVARPKGPGIQINTQNNVNGAGVNGTVGGLSFEQRLREIRAKREIEAPHAIMLEAPKMTQAEKLAEEFEGAGIDLSDEDIDALEGDIDGDEEEIEEDDEAS